MTSGARKPAKLAIGFGVFAAGLAALLVVEGMLASSGKREPFENPSRAPREIGSGGSELTYAVLGDSTAAGQGARYERGIAVATARHLASAGRRISLVNLSVSRQGRRCRRPAAAAGGAPAPARGARGRGRE